MEIKSFGTIKIIFVFSIVFLFGLIQAHAQSIGETTIAQWLDNKEAAFTLLFDDSMVTQADNAMPAMIERGLTGSWFINPEEGGYEQRKEVWESAPYNGQELDNHTMHHEGARSYEEADYEIGACSQLIWSLNPPGTSKLLGFCQGGGTTWNITEEEMQKLLDKYYLIDRHAHNCVVGASAEEMFSYAQEALDNRMWNIICFHGIGGQWLSNDTDEFVKFLDYLVDVKDRLWVGGYIHVYKYVQERDTASVSVLEANENRIRLNLISAMDNKLDYEGLRLYDAALTLITNVPSSWTSAYVKQGNKTKKYIVKNGKIQYNVVPGIGEIIITPSLEERTGDLDSDGDVDIFDLISLLSKWRTSDNSADLNSSGEVDIFDLIILLQNWG